jgi:hypothetical protein
VSCGDANGDGVVNSLDSLWILWLAAGIVDAVEHPEAADLDENGEINAIDAALVLQVDAGFLAGLDC